MARRKRSILDRYPVTEKYLTARAGAFHMPAQKMLKTIKPENKVYGAVIDIPMGPNLLSTLVCFANGAANLLYNSGGGVIGAATKYRPVAHAARSLIVSSEQCLPIFEKVTSYDLPFGKPHYVYLLTRDGIYKTVITPDSIKSNDKNRRLLFFLYQNVINEIRTAQMREEKAKLDAEI